MNVSQNRARLFSCLSFCALLAVVSPALAGTHSDLDPEFRIGLTQKGLKRLLPRFSKDVKTRHDIYFDFFCDGEFISASQTKPFKLRVKEKPSDSTIQYSTTEEKFAWRELNTPVSYRISESQEEGIDAKNALIRKAKEFLKAAAQPAKKFLALAKEVQALYQKDDYLGRKELEIYLHDPRCTFIPSGENEKTRHSLLMRTKDGTELAVKLGVTYETDANGKQVESYELEADPVEADEAYELDREAVARDLIDFLTDGEGLSQDEISEQPSLTGLYIRTQMLKALSPTP